MTHSVVLIITTPRVLWRPRMPLRCSGYSQSRYRAILCLQAEWSYTRTGGAGGKSGLQGKAPATGRLTSWLFCSSNSRPSPSFAPFILPVSPWRKTPVLRRATGAWEESLSVVASKAFPLNGNVVFSNYCITILHNCHCAVCLFCYLALI